MTEVREEGKCRQIGLVLLLVWVVLDNKSVVFNALSSFVFFFFDFSYFICSCVTRVTFCTKQRCLKKFCASGVVGS